MMREVPPHQAGDTGRTVSRMPFGGFAVLDTAHPVRVPKEGELPKKPLGFPSDREQLHSVSSIDLVATGIPHRLGLGDFGSALDDCQQPCQRQSACQLEAPISRRIPLKHLASPKQASMSANRSKAGQPSQPVNSTEGGAQD